MSGLLIQAGYEPVIAEDMEAAKLEVAMMRHTRQPQNVHNSAG